MELIIKDFMKDVIQEIEKLIEKLIAGEVEIGTFTNTIKDTKILFLNCNNKLN